MSAADELEDFYDDTVTVRTLTGTGGMGNIYEPTDDVRCFVDNTRAVVRDADGTETISESTLTCPPEYAGIFQPGSQVTLEDRVSTVIKAAHARPGRLDLPAHVEVSLT